LSNLTTTTARLRHFTMMTRAVTFNDFEGRLVYLSPKGIQHCEKEYEQLAQSKQRSARKIVVLILILLSLILTREV